MASQNALTDAVIENQRRNVEALYRTNLLIVEGTQAFVNRQFDIAREAIGEFAQMFQNLISPQVSADERLAWQAQQSKQVVEKSLDSVQAFGEIAGKVHAEALHLVSQQLMSGFDQMSGYLDRGPSRMAAE